MSQKSSLALSTDVYNHLRSAYQLPTPGLNEVEFQAEAGLLVFFKYMDDYGKVHLCLLKHIGTGKLVTPKEFKDFLRQFIVMPDYALLTLITQAERLAVVKYTTFAELVLVSPA